MIFYIALGLLVAGAFVCLILWYNIRKVVPKRLDKLDLERLNYLFIVERRKPLSEFNKSRIAHAIRDRLVDDHDLICCPQMKGYLFEFFVGYIIWQKSKMVPSRSLNHFDSAIIEKFLNLCSHDLTIAQAMEMKKSIEANFIQALFVVSGQTTIPKSSPDIQAIRAVINLYFTRAVLGKFRTGLVKIDKPEIVKMVLIETGELGFLQEIIKTGSFFGTEREIIIQGIITEYLKDKNLNPAIEEFQFA